MYIYMMVKSTQANLMIYSSPEFCPIPAMSLYFI